MRLGRKLVAVMVLGIAAILGAACSPSGTAGPVMETAVEEAEAASSAYSGLPDYAYRSAQAARGYRIATAEKELLSVLPCYCGCGQDAENYKNLSDCFFVQDGDFNSHAANCQICLEQAEDAARWKGEGLTRKEIRDRTDREYEGRGKATDTPPIA